MKRYLGLLLLAGLLTTGIVLSAEERYDYDELGRLVRVVPSNGQGNTYSYDEAGNLLRVDGVEIPPPHIPDSDVENIRCGVPQTVFIAGENLHGVRVTASSPAVHISDFQQAEGGIRFTLLIECSVTGSVTLHFTTAAGSISLEFPVAPATPLVFTTPAPLAVPPDSSARTFLLRLSHADVIDHTFTLGSASEQHLQVLTPQLTIPAGNLQAQGRIAGLTQGQTSLEIVAAELDAVSVPVFVTADFAGVNTSRADLLGVLRPVGPIPPTAFSVDLTASGIGILNGPAITGIEPQAVTVGSEGEMVAVHGIGLDQAVAAHIVPDEDLTIHSVDTFPDGSQVSLNLDVAEHATPGLRRVIMTSADGAAFPVLAPGDDRLKIALRGPVIESVTPIVLRPGEASVPLVIRGQRLVDIQAVRVTPAEGVDLEQSYSPNETGTELVTRVSVAPHAAAGPRILSVVTAGGSSDAVPSPANTLNIVADVTEEVPLLAGNPVGVVRTPVAPPREHVFQVDARAVGLVSDQVVTGIEPDAVVVGTSRELAIHGIGLQAVDAVSIHPADDINTALVDVSPDGRTATVAIDVAANAALTERRLRLLAGSSFVPPVTPDADRLRIVLPSPVMHSVSPLHLVPNSPNVLLRIGGENLRDGVPVFSPPEGISVGAIDVSSSGDEVFAEIAVSDGAPLGPRVVEVITPSGGSGVTPGPHNTVWINAESGTTYPALSGTSLGVHRETQESPPEPVSASVNSTVVGVARAVLPVDIVRSYTPLVSSLQIIKGNFATDVMPDASLPDSELELFIAGIGLEAVTAVEFRPADGVMALAPPVHDGANLRVAVLVAPDAAAGPRTLRLMSDDGAVVPFTAPHAALFRVGHAKPRIDSIEPILAGRGDIAQLLIRGRDLLDAFEVFAEPAIGLRFSPYVTVNEAGTELTVNMAVDADAPLGPRVIRVRVPGAVSSGVGEPANTFTVYESVPE